MLPCFLSIAHSSVPVFQRILLGEHPSTLLVIIYSVAIVLGPIIGLISAIGMIAIWGERKVAGHMQCRPGPNRVGPFGLFQSLADGIKLILKEDLIPGSADSILFRLAPYLAFAPVFAAFVVIPFAPEMAFEPRLNVGVFYLLAVLSVEVMGVILAGWASNNKWSVYGAMREACQMVSYEIPLGLSIIVAVMAAGTLNLVQVGHLQGGGIHTWLVFRNPFVFLAFFVYFVASLASNKRAPFDLPESESELVAGFHTEYSGMRFAFFFFAEYAAMFVVGAIQTALFLGAWHDPFGLLGMYHERFMAQDSKWGLLAVNLIGAGIFTLKSSLVMFIQMWLRWTLPRPRIDQVLYACVKVLLPLACVILLGAALWQLFVPDPVGIPWVAAPAGYRPFVLGDYRANGWTASLLAQIILSTVGVVLSLAVVGWVGYAAINARRVKKRLSEPSPINLKPERLVGA